MTKLLATVSTVGLLLACSSHTPPEVAESPAPGPRPESVASEPTASAEKRAARDEAQPDAKPAPEPARPLAKIMPTGCEPGADCTPPLEFARETCKGRYPDMAIAMFERRTPWKRLYSKAESIEAVNAYGSRDTPDPITYGEEVLLLRAAGGGMTSSADVDVLRWDGTCATVSRELFADHQMREVSNALIEWRSLDGYMRQALLKSKYVKLTYEAQKAACKDVRFSDSSEECERANFRLNDAITVAVRGGTTLPVPEKLPAWAPPEMAAQTVASNSDSLRPF